MSATTAAHRIANQRFQNALSRRPQATPPIWLMRQAGRYHRHYQNLRRQHSFVELCKSPNLAAEVALGPVLDFDFDAAILFSDLLFPLEALGMGLEYTDAGPKLAWKLNKQTLPNLRSSEEAWPNLLFQGEAMRATRALLPPDRSLIGFVGGPWTLFVYATEGTHLQATNATKQLHLFESFCETLLPLLQRNIEHQFANGAELVMVFDTAAGALSAKDFGREVVPQLELLTRQFHSRLGYYSKSTTAAHLRRSSFTEGAWAGIAVDHHWELREAFDLFPQGFIQGNFDPAYLLCSPAELKRRLMDYLQPLIAHKRPGWICSLGHGVLPATPEPNVRLFVETVREVLQ
ncbi:MAG TPA: uroporphyrinogen decarboxylase family protein [Pyrinomonadaceae bacterium]|nr:uroporphyrinogen decarboxylase family protein [Pyrinomonadaceae bacterium]